MKRLDGRVALVTGAGRGIGAATCRRLGGEGAIVLVTDLDAGAAGRVSRELTDSGIRSSSRCVDVASAADMTAAVSFALSEWGSLDVVHHNAGVGLLSPLETTSDDDVRRLIEVNVLGTVNAVRSAGPVLRNSGGGSLILTGSLAADYGTPMQAVYSATKGAVASITRAAAMELAPTVRVNAVSPGSVRSEGHVETFGPEVAALIDELAADNAPLGRIAEPDEIASVVAFLASDDASYITGEIVRVGAGWGRGDHSVPDAVIPGDAK